MFTKKTVGYAVLTLAAGFALGVALTYISNPDTIDNIVDLGQMYLQDITARGLAEYPAIPHFSDSVAISEKVVGTANSQVGVCGTIDEYVSAPLRYTNDAHISGWCADFAQWVYGQVGLDIGKIGLSLDGLSDALNFLSSQDALIEPHMANMVQPGDLTIMESSGGLYGGHVGIVADVQGDQLTLIEGNYSNCVQEVVRSFSDPLIQGYGDLDNLPLKP